MHKATLAWNLTTTAFFKAGGQPWKLGTSRLGVCYVGVVFKKDAVSADPGNACCGAQMFLDSGDGVVFRGAVGPWYSPTSKQFHLSKEKAKVPVTLKFADMIGEILTAGPIQNDLPPLPFRYYI